MKRAKILIYSVAAFVAALFVQSCSDSSLSDTFTTSKSKLETTLAEKTSSVIDAVIQAYQEVDNLAFDSEFENAVSGILANSDIDYPQVGLVNDSMMVKLQLLYLYKQVASEYAVLADNGFTGKQDAFSKCCNNITSYYSTLGDSVALQTVKVVKSHINSKRYSESAVMSCLFLALEEIWSDDIKTWSANLNQSFLDYQNTLASIPESSFNEEKLSKYVFQPYEGKHNLVEAYKLNLLKERRNQLLTFLNKTSNITSALQCLHSATDELKKDRCDKTTVLNLLNRVDVLIGNINNVSTANE